MSLWERRAHARLEGIAPVIADSVRVIGAGKLGIAGFVADIPGVAEAGILVIARTVPNSAAIAAAPPDGIHYGRG